jgi:hypothetical protein
VRHVLSRKEKIRGVRAALASPRTPHHLKAGLKRYLDSLQRELSGQEIQLAPKKRRSQKRRMTQLSDWFR